MGRAVVYNSWSEPINGIFHEQLAPGCFDESLAMERDIIATVWHNERLLLGRTRSKTLRLLPGAEGIDVEVDYPDISYARDLATSIARGDVAGMSFIFDVLDDGWETRDGVPHRTVKKADIYEVTFTAFPAYPATTCGARAIKRAFQQELQYYRDWLRLVD